MGLREIKMSRLVSGSVALQKPPRGAFLRIREQVSLLNLKTRRPSKPSTWGDRASCSPSSRVSMEGLSIQVSWNMNPSKKSSFGRVSVRWLLSSKYWSILPPCYPTNLLSQTKNENLAWNGRPSNWVSPGRWEDRSSKRLMPARSTGNSSYTMQNQDIQSRTNLKKKQMSKLKAAIRTMIRVRTISLGAEEWWWHRIWNKSWGCRMWKREWASLWTCKRRCQYWRRTLRWLWVLRSRRWESQRWNCL